MVTKAQPRSWKTPNLDTFGEEAWQRVEQMNFKIERIAALLAAARRTDLPEGWRALVERKIRDNAWMLVVETEFDQRPTVPEIEAALIQVRDLARDLHKALHALDHESCRALAARLPNPSGVSHWRRVREARRDPVRIYLAARSALRGLPRKPAPTRDNPDRRVASKPARLAVKRAVSRLADLWELLTECSRPGRQNRETAHDGPVDVIFKTEATGPFAECVELALRPALPTHKPFDAAIREGLKLPPRSSWT